MFPEKIELLLQNLEKDAGEVSSVPKETAIFLFTLVKILKPSSILEVGTAKGYSTIWLAMAALEGKVTTIEKNPERVSQAIINFRKATLSNIEARHGNALEIIPSLRSEFDFVFLDGAKHEYAQYLSLILPKLKPSATVIADNALSHKDKLREFVAELRARGINYAVLPIGKGLIIFTAPAKTRAENENKNKNKNENKKRVIA